MVLHGVFYFMESECGVPSCINTSWYYSDTYSLSMHVVWETLVSCVEIMLAVKSPCFEECSHSYIKDACKFLCSVKSFLRIGLFPFFSVTFSLCETKYWNIFKMSSVRLVYSGFYTINSFYDYSV